MSTNFVPLHDKMGTQPGNNHLGGSQRREGFTGITHVKLVSNAPDEDFQTGRTKAPVITMEPPQSVNILVDSRNRLNFSLTEEQNPFDFQISIGSNLYRSRFMKVSKVLLPKVPNITNNNNNVKLRMSPNADINVTLPTGFYTTTTFASALQLALSQANGGANSFTCTYNSLNRTFRLLLNAPIPEKFFIETECNFIQKGTNFVPFPSQSNILDPAVFGALFFDSAMANMTYTRYAMLCSGAFNNYSFADSKTTDPLVNEDILAIVDLNSMHDPEDWDVGRIFTGGYVTIQTPEAPFLSLRNPQRNLAPEADVYVLDEYGINLNESFQIFPAIFGFNRSGVSFWMEVTF